MASAKHRLKRRAEFLRVAAKGARAPMPGLVLQALVRDDPEPARLGFTVTKKVGNAVVRNRTKRRLREAARLLLRDAPLSGVDLVLIGRDGTAARPLPALIDDLARALRKTGARGGARQARQGDTQAGDGRHAPSVAERPGP
jgi:ribonuclease P protein component